MEFEGKQLIKLKKIIKVFRQTTCSCFEKFGRRRRDGRQICHIITPRVNHEINLQAKNIANFFLGICECLYSNVRICVQNFTYTGSPSSVLYLNDISLMEKFLFINALKTS